MGFFVYSLSTKASFPDSYWGLGVTTHQLYPESDVYDRCFDTAFRQLTAKDAVTERYHSDYCRALEERKRPDDAIVQGLAAIALNPDYAEAHKCLARAYLQKGDTKSAETHAEKVLHLLAAS